MALPLDLEVPEQSRHEAATLAAGRRLGGLGAMGRTAMRIATATDIHTDTHTVNDTHTAARSAAEAIRLAGRSWADR